jgi:hypothetical protein
MKTFVNGRVRARTVSRVTAIAVTAMILLSGCFYSYADEVQHASPDQRPWFCNSIGNGTPLSGHGNGSHVHPIYEGKTKGPLSWDDCIALSHQLDHTLTAVRGLDTKAKGEAAGWRQLAAYIPGLGTHHARLPAGLQIPSGSIPPGSIPPGTRPATPRPPGSLPPGLFPQATFDPASPQFLIYGGPQDDAPLVGVAFAFFGAGTPPAAYAGDNDWWHLHSKICLGPNNDILAGAEEIPDAQCTALGGRQQVIGQFPGSTAGSAAGGIWLLHVWLVSPYEYKLDIFASGHNCLMADGVAPQTDPCWEVAHRDPALGMPPGAGGSHDGTAHDH